MTDAPEDPIVWTIWTSRQKEAPRMGVGRKSYLATLAHLRARGDTYAEARWGDGSVRRVTLDALLPRVPA